MGNILEGGGDLLSGFLGESTIDTSAIDSLLEDITGSIEFYFVNTGVPGNPGEGDNDGDGRVDEECLNGEKDDDDDLVDEDAVASGMIPGWPPGNTTPCP